MGEDAGTAGHGGLLAAAVCAGVPAAVIAVGVRRGRLDSIHLVERKSKEQLSPRQWQWLEDELRRGPPVWGYDRSHAPRGSPRGLSPSRGRPGHP
ncbi:hypothetical protein FAF44_46950 [Nonomuraea sp. MG754425]|nr:hypothetical protein [Nonomuraea sp. MG754425]